MRKTYLVRLTEDERNKLHGIVKNVKGTGENVPRAQILPEQRLLPGQSTFMAPNAVSTRQSSSTMPDATGSPWIPSMSFDKAPVHGRSKGWVVPRYGLSAGSARLASALARRSFTAGSSGRSAARRFR